MTDESRMQLGRMSRFGSNKATNATAGIAGFITGFVVGLGVCGLLWYLKVVIYNRGGFPYFYTDWGIHIGFTVLSLPVTGFVSGLLGTFLGIRNNYKADIKDVSRNRMKLSLLSGAKGGLIPGLVCGLVSGILFGGMGSY